MWLDELQRYLDGEHGLTGGVVRALLNAPHPAVIIGTLWPDRYTAYTTVPAPGGADPHAREREVLDLADVIRIGPEFSPAEQDRARAAAARDPRLRVALEAAGYGLTQTLAAAPQLVARWEDAQTASPYAWAVLTAALDAARLGARAPLSADFLRAAAPGYCTSQQQAEAPDNWFEQALAYATGKLHGAAAALSPAGAGMGQVAGYTAADYLIQHASRERRYARVPASTWDAVLSHIRDPADTARLADSARNRLLYRYAIPLYRHAADAGDGYAAWRLAELLAERGDLDGQDLRARADAGDGDAAGQLAELLAERGDLDGLRARADAGDGMPPGGWPTCWPSAATWTGLRSPAGRRRRRDAAWRLADLLAERGDLDGAAQILRADAGDGDAAGRLAGLLAERGDLDELRARADAGDGDAAWRLAELLAERGDLDGAAQSCAPGPTPATGMPPGSWPTCWPSAATWTGPVCAPGPTPATGMPPGSWPTCWPSAATWTGPADPARPGRRRRRVCRLAAGRAAGRARRPGRAARARADAGDGHAAARLADLLAERGDLDGLRARADAGDGHAARRLADLLAERGDLDGAAQICAPGPTPATGLPPCGWPPAGRARRPGRAARPGRRRRRACRRAAGRAAGRARRPGRAARPGRRRRRGCRRAAGRAC